MNILGRVDVKGFLMEIAKIVEALEEVAEHEGSEWGEFLGLLCEFNHYSYCFSEDFKKAFDNELRKEYNHFKENYELKTVTKTQTVTYKVVEPKDDMEE